MVSALRHLTAETDVSAAVDLSPQVAIEPLRERLRGSSLVSVRVGLRGSRDSVASAIQDLIGGAPSVSVSLRGDAAGVVSEIRGLQGTGADVEVSAAVRVEGSGTAVASALRSLAGVSVVSANVELRGSGAAIIPHLLEAAPGSLDVSFAENDP